ncbi:MAG TPA: PAS domain S-box protein [Candidatus Acidoferrales bacterium]|nr:PAS domain S-box protein [Candidatus Acidoferrales bacterium]
MLPLGKFPKLLIALALLVAALLFLDLEVVHNAARSLLFSNSLDFVIVVLGALASSYAARRSQGYARQLWTLLSIALFLEALAQAITTYYQSFVPGSSQLPSPSDILFFVWTAPVFMMFLPAADEKSRGWDWLRILDFAQIAIVAITAYLYFFYSPSRWLANSSELPRQILILYITRDAIISTGFFFRSRKSASAGLRSFSLGMFFVFLAAVFTDGNYLLTLKTSLSTATWGDFLFLFPYLGVIFLAVAWPRRDSDSIAEPVSRFDDLAVTNGFPVVIPLLVLFMGRAIAIDRFALAWIAISASFLCSAVRLILTNRKQRRVSQELLQTERALAHSEHLLSSAFRSSPDGFAINVFPDGPYLDVNDGFTRLTGYSREEVLGKTPLQLNLWTKPALRTHTLSELNEHAEIRNVEFAFQTKSGQIRTGQLSGSLLELDGRRCALVVVRDISEQRKAVDSLRESEERFRSFVENLHVGIVSSSPIGEILYANPAALNLFELRLEQVTGKMLIDLHLEPLREDGSVLPDSEGLIPTVVSSRRPLHNLVVGWRHLQSSKTIWTLLDAVPQFNSSGEVTNILVSLTDLSEQRRATEALRESEERFRTLVRDLHVGVILAGPDGTFEFANQAAVNMSNVAGEQIIGRTADELGIIPVDERGRDIPYADRPVPTVIRTKRPLRQASMGYRIPGTSELLWIFGNAIPQFNPDGSILRVIATFTDITDLKNAERSIHQLSTELLKLQDEERRRIGRELHDGMAQTVLAVNLSLAQLRQSAQPLNEASHRALEKARELLQQMSREIRTLSYLLHPPLLDDLGLVSALKEYVNGFSERSGIETSLELLTSFRRLPQIAETAFFRITQESLANIQRHSGSKRAEVILREDPECVTLQITDFGSGMSIPANGAPHRGQPRLGVGIPGMKERMAQLGGSLEIDSSATGTTVRARILFSAPVLQDSIYDASLHPYRG